MLLEGKALLNTLSAVLLVEISMAPLNSFEIVEPASAQGLAFALCNRVYTHSNLLEKMAGNKHPFIL